MAIQEDRELYPDSGRQCRKFPRRTAKIKIELFTILPYGLGVTGQGRQEVGKRSCKRLTVKSGGRMISRPLFFY